MTMRAARIGRLALPATMAALAVAMALGGCASIKDHKGYLADNALVATVQPGIDNRDSVTKTLGRPSFVGEFDPTVWYYVSRDTRARAFGLPHPVKQEVVTVRFDPQGNVASVRKTGMETIASIDPAMKKTPVLGSHTSFFQALFGNIGAVGSGGQTGTTADKPN